MTAARMRLRDIALGAATAIALPAGAVAGEVSGALEVRVEVVLPCSAALGETGQPMLRCGADDGAEEPASGAAAAIATILDDAEQADGDTVTVTTVF
jgi:hypothetical protein